MIEKKHNGYALAAGETPVYCDEVAIVLIYVEGRPIKMVYPDGRVEPFAKTTGKPN